MKLSVIQGTDNKHSISLRGKRVSKNVVAQLANNNKYSLTAPNQRYILKSLDELSKVSGEKNINFLMNIAANSKYSTNIKLQDSPKYNWKAIVADTLKKVIAITPFVKQQELFKKVDEILDSKELTPDEKEILKLKDFLLKSVNLEQIKKETVGGIQDFERNLDYFIVSSETTVEHKKYVLERLNYFMSYRYNINPQLRDKKSIVVAEMINDMAIATPGHKIPNIKAVNQKQHGMCAAISIVRKKLAYEDKPNYVDSILSELDSSKYISVYDRSKLGSGEKIEVAKAYVDFDSAIEKGYRIIDASTMHWMQLAHHSGYSASSSNNYNPFDKSNFDVKNDTFFNPKFEDPELSSLQTYYQALAKAKSFIDDYKAASIKKQVKSIKARQDTGSALKVLADIMASVRAKLAEIDGLKECVNIDVLSNRLIRLERKNSSKIEDASFEYIANEEASSKIDKITAFIEKQGAKKGSVSKKLASELLDFINFYHETERSVKSKSRSSVVRRAQDLYSIGAGFRYQFVEGLNSKKVLDEIMSREKMQDKESLIMSSIEELLGVLKNGSPEIKNLIVNQLSEKMNLDNPSQRSVIKYLNQLKDNMKFMTEDAFDNINASLALENKRAVLSDYIDNIIYDITENGNVTALHIAEDNLGTSSEENTLAELEKMKEKVLSSTEEEYTEIFRLLGEHSQVDFIKGSLMEVANAISEAENTDIIDGILMANGLPTENRETTGPELLNAIATQIDSINDSIEKYTEFLKITDEDGDILYSPDPRDLIIKKYEAKKEIPSSKDLRELQVHIDKIYKVKSKDEFNSRQGKISDKSLLNFTKSEKNTLSYIEDNVNSFNRYLQKQITAMQYYMKDQFEELNRQVGVDKGSWWVMEGSSGLTDGQQIRVLEYITGRPHYETTNLEDAIEKMKKSPYSGITGSSVFHDRAGMHSQYVADIAPVKVKIKDENGNIKESVKEVLFQDNSWGPSEHENIWIDDAGLERTDYSDNRGGTLGYITNEKFQNGNYVDRIVNEMVLEDKDENIESKMYRKIKHPSREVYTGQQYSDVILDGKSSKISDVADSIHDTLFASSADLMSLMPGFLKEMSYDDAQAKISNIKNRISNWESKLESLNQRIFEPLGGGINSEQQYNSLPDDDELKVILEKTALRMNYKMTDQAMKIATVRNVRDLAKYSRLQKKRATQDFAYAFSKNIMQLDWFTDNITEKNMEDIDEILKKYSIEVSDKDFDKLFLTFTIDDKEFDGSLKNTIRLLTKQLETRLSESLKNPGAVKELTDYFKNIAEKKLYYSENDLKAAGDDSKIVKFIDRVYDPQDNEEFVSIYRQIQDMTTDEFKNSVLSKATNEDLGIGNRSGYDVLKELKLYKKQTESAFKNAVAYDDYSDSSDYKNYKVSYNLNKFSRTPKYTYKHDFESVYTDMQNSLSLLTLPKLFNRYKAANLYTFGAYPAYPKLDYMPESMMSSDFEYLSSNVPTTVNQITVMRNMLRYYELTDEIRKITDKLKDANILIDDEYAKLNLALGEIVTMVYDDPSAKEVFEAASEAMELEEGSAYILYKDHINKLLEYANEYKKGCSAESLNQSIAIQKEVLSKGIEMFTNTLIQSRYRSKINLLIQKYKKSLIRRDNSAETILNELWSEYCRAHILNNPEELLDTYVLASVKDSPKAEFITGYSAMLDRALRYSVLYDVQVNMMTALKSGIETGVKTGFNDIEIKLANGEVKKMGADEVISQMVCSMILDNDMETALMFLDKFGLNEQYVTYTATSFDYDEIKTLMKSADEACDNFENFSKLYNDSTAKAYELLSNGENAIKVINMLKRTFKEASLQYSVDNKTKLLPRALDKIKKEYVNDHPVDVKGRLETALSEAMSEISAASELSVDNINSILSVYEVMFSIANNLCLKDGCEAVKVRNDMNKKFEQLMKYRDSLNNAKKQ